MTGKKDDWDYALRIRGATPRGLALARLGEYLRAYAELLGDAVEPHFAGVVKGSALLRASIPPEHKLNAQARLVLVKLDADDATIGVVDTLAKMLDRDGFIGGIEDRAGAVILEFPKRAKQAEPREYIVQDSGVIDGVVVGLVGVDDTVHVRLLDSTSKIHKVTVRGIAKAWSLATYFRGTTLRVHVHGTWKRTSEGVWEPHSLYLDRFEELDDEPASEILSRLSALPGNRWSTMEDPEALLRSLRGTNDRRTRRQLPLDLGIPQGTRQAGPRAP